MPSLAQVEVHEFAIDLKLFRLKAVKKAAYRFCGQYFIELSQPYPSQVIVKLTQRGDASGPPLPATAFLGEVLDQDLREIVAEETSGVRDLIMAQALGGVALFDAQGEHGDYHEDQLRVETANSDLKPLDRAET